MGDKVSYSEVQRDVGGRIESKKRRVSGGWGLGLAKVITVNYEEFQVTLRVMLGDDQEFQRVPIQLSFPSAGHRHILGAMPEIGDMCVIGWTPQEGSEGTKTPVILGWLVPGTYMGHDWTITAPFSPDEYSMDPKDAAFIEAAGNRIRNKLRHLNPGNIVGSSSQGADLILDESATLSNRRCNELILRDQDQALVTRSLQRFSVLAGTRVYAGMVQRDSTFLPSQMFSDGIEWDAARLIDRQNNEPLSDFDLESSSHPFGMLRPAEVFDKERRGIVGDLAASGIAFEPDLDPYLFLERGLFVTSEGFTYDGKTQSDAVYGGKPFFRVGLSPDPSNDPSNAVYGVEEALTEYRLELDHTSNGVLPVSEQTDGFDAERLPRASQTSLDLMAPSRYMQVVYGSVVGNDPFSLAGRRMYGKPLKLSLFDDSGAPKPLIDSAVGSPLGEHAASLFKLEPPVSPPGQPTWWGTLKDGRVRAHIAGPQNEAYSAEVVLQSGLNVSAGGKIRFDAKGGLELNMEGDRESAQGLNLAVPKGAVRIYGGGKSSADAFSRRISPTGGGEQDAPGLQLEARYNTQVKAGRKVDIQANTVETKASQVNTSAMNGVEMTSGEKIALSAKVISMVANGKLSMAIHGPKDNLPTNGVFREVKITGLGIGTVDDYSVQLGDREELFFAGNHTTSVLVGNLTYETLAGTWKAAAGLNSLSVDVATGIDASATVGNISASALAGAVTISGQVALTAKSTGAAVVSGTAGVSLGGPGKVGNIICSTDLDPLTGAPLQAYGMGSPGHTLVTPV